MKFLVVVLALSGLCAAEPEADPALLLASPYAAAFAPFAPYSVAPFAYAHAPFVPHGRFLTPHDCVTPGGCNARTLIDAGLARKKRDAEADPALFYSNAFPHVYNPYSLNAYTNAFPYAAYNYAPVVHHAPLVHRAPVAVSVIEDHTRPVTYTHLGAHPLTNPATVLETDRRISHRLIKREAEAEAEADPALFYSNAFPHIYNPYNFNAYSNAFPYAAYNYAPVVHRAPVAVPVVYEHTRPVTYTHLGAHPLTNPATVLQTDRRIAHHLL